MFDERLAILLFSLFIDMSHNILLRGFRDDRFQSCREDDAFLSIYAFSLFETRLHSPKDAFHTQELKDQLIEI